MKKLYSALFILAFSLLGLVHAQPVADFTAIDCQSNSKSLHQVLGTGKAVIVASKGFDCGICRGRAAGWGSWASQNKASVEVWGAMTNTYSNNIPSCNSLNTWVSDYAWQDVFSFIDSNEYFFESGTPRYLVFSPADSTRIYLGGSESAARNAALGASLLGQREFERSPLQRIHFYYSAQRLYFESVPREAVKVQLFNLAGSKERLFRLEGQDRSFDLSGLPRGIYLLRFESQSGMISRKLVIS